MIHALHYLWMNETKIVNISNSFKPKEISITGDHSRITKYQPLTSSCSFNIMSIDCDSIPENLVFDAKDYQKIQEWYKVDQINTDNLEFMCSLVEPMIEGPNHFDALCPELASIIRKCLPQDTQDLLSRTDLILRKANRTAAEELEFVQRFKHLRKIRGSLLRLRRYIFPHTIAQVKTPSPKKKSIRYVNTSPYILKKSDIMHNILNMHMHISF